MTKILSLGHSPLLMQIRTMVLHGAGYLVQEVYTNEDALQSLRTDKFDLVLICHTVPETEQRELIDTIRLMLPILPVVCISSNRTLGEHCDSIDNVAPAFLTDLSRVLRKGVFRI